jgi:hypothetical protein
MKRGIGVDQLLRWYPESWRARYGDEFLALLEDRLHGAPPSIRLRASVAMAGMRERCYASGMVGGQSSRLTQRRTGSLMVLVAWAIMIVGGAGLTKTAEHFAVAVPSRSRELAQIAYNVTAVAGIVGTLFVVAGAIAAFPGFLRLVRAKRWTKVGATFVWPAAALVVLALAALGMSVWARHLNVAQRNGADHIYSGAFLLLAFIAVLTIGLWVRAIVTVAWRIDFTARALRWESWFALGVSVNSVFVTVSAVLWWIQMGLHAPWFLQGAAIGDTASPWSINLVVAVVPMVLAVLIALWGASRVAASYRPTPRDAGNAG